MRRLAFASLRSWWKEPPKQELEGQPVCRNCYKRVWAKRGNTLNLLSHLHDNPPPPKECTETSKFVLKCESPTLLETVQKGNMYGAKSPQARELNRAVGYFLAKDMQPLYTVTLILVSKLTPSTAYTFPKILYWDWIPQTVQWNNNC